MSEQCQEKRHGYEKRTLIQIAYRMVAVRNHEKPERTVRTDYKVTKNSLRVFKYVEMVKRLMMFRFPENII